MRTFACAWLAASMFIVNLSSLPSLNLSVIFLVAMLLLFLRIPRSRPWIAGMALALLSVSLTLFQLANHQLHPEQVSADLRLSVQVDSVPEKYDRRLAFVAKVLTCLSCEREFRVKKIKLSWYGQYPDVRAGQTWQLTVRLKPPASYRNPGSFDAVALSLVKGVHARGYVKVREGANKIAERTGFSLSALRQQAAERLTGLSGNNDYVGLLQGLTVGVKTHISQDQWDVLRSTGTAHLLAISGLHVGLVAAWVLIAGRFLSAIGIALLQRCFKSVWVFDTRAWVLSMSLLAATAYAGLAGFELPTQRAVLMLSVWMIASLRFRFLPPLAALCLALIAVLSINSLNVMSAGFWLSFGTVATLFFLHRGHLRNERALSLGRLTATVQKVKALGSTHVLLGVALLPISAWFFQSGSLIAPAANLLAVPWVAMVSVPLSLIGLVASTISDTIALPVLTLATGSLQLLFTVLRVLDSSTLSSVVITVPGFTSFALVVLGLLVTLAPYGLGLRLLALPLFLPVVIHNTTLPAADGFEVHVLDVGQGLAALVFHGDQTLLFDTGGKVSPKLSMFEAVVVPFLQASGRRRIDTLVVSHGDEDHAFGVADVISRYPDVLVYASQALNLPSGYPLSACVAGAAWSVGAVQFGFLHPGMSDSGSDNNRSCVLMIHTGTSRALLTGDIEASAERAILSRLNDDTTFPVTLMTAPHHGSKSSSTQAFIDKLRPQYVVFPAGRRNRFGFPHRDVQLRYKLVGSESFVTGRNGAISFWFDTNGLSRPPTSWWHSHRRFWHGIVNPDCWQRFAGQSLVLRLLKLSQKGKTLCGK